MVWKKNRRHKRGQALGGRGHKAEDSSKLRKARESSSDVVRRGTAIKAIKEIGIDVEISKLWVNKPTEIGNKSEAITSKVINSSRIEDLAAAAVAKVLE